MNEYQELTETFKEKNIGTWDCSYQASKLNYWLCNNMDLLIDHKVEMDIEGRTYQLKNEEKQMRIAIKGPVWLRKQLKTIDFGTFMEEFGDELEEEFIAENPELFPTSDSMCECDKNQEFQDWTEKKWGLI